MTFDPELSKINKNKNHENKKQNHFTGPFTQINSEPNDGQ